MQHPHGPLGRGRVLAMCGSELWPGPAILGTCHGLWGRVRRPEEGRAMCRGPRAKVGEARGYSEAGRGVGTDQCWERDPRDRVPFRLVRDASSRAEV